MTKYEMVILTKDIMSIWGEWYFTIGFVSAIFFSASIFFSAYDNYSEKFSKNQNPSMLEEVEKEWSSYWGIPLSSIVLYPVVIIIFIVWIIITRLHRLVPWISKKMEIHFIKNNPEKFI